MNFGSPPAKMTTLEKLFLQIFELKAWILKQVRQQADAYTQLFASRLLLDGITPPPSLLNPSFSLNPNELEKEEIISRLLLQPSRDSVAYSRGGFSWYYRPVVAGGNGQLSAEMCMETHAHNQGHNVSNEPPTMFECRNNDTGRSLNCVTEKDDSVNSPENETDARISSIYAVPDTSLARIQRSKSRQKARELRTPLSKKRKLSGLLGQECYHISGANSVAAEGEGDKGNVGTSYSSRPTRSGSSYEKPSCLNDHPETSLSSEKEKLDGSILVPTTSKSLEQSGLVNEIVINEENENAEKSADKEVSLKKKPKNHPGIRVSKYEEENQTSLMATRASSRGKNNLFKNRGKRDIVVKALEVAKAAKRREERKLNERKMKLEALKVERARMEKENAREMELNKKKKQEELKKKEADIAARKRQREEDERKQLAKKRKLVAEARKEQKLQYEKSRAGKAEMEKQHAKNAAIAGNKKRSENPRQNRNGDEKSFQRNDTELRADENLASVGQQVTSVLENCDTSNLCGGKEKVYISIGSMKMTRQENSYDISPYQCSDDEDDDKPTKKFVPSWASKHRMAMVLPLQQKLDPETIFSIESFCIMDEVLLPRRLHAK